MLDDPAFAEAIDEGFATYFAEGQLRPADGPGRSGISSSITLGQLERLWKTYTHSVQRTFRPATLDGASKWRGAEVEMCR